MVFKRKRTFAPRGGKRRRTMVRRKRFSRKKVADYTSLNTKGSSIGYGGKKTSRRAFRKHLWDSTLFKTHWRSLSATAISIATPANDVAGTLVGLNMYKNPGSEFWTAAGGTLATDTGSAVPLFVGDIILRGGMYETTIANASANDIRVKLFVLKTNADPAFAFEPVGPPFNWDPTVSPDFARQIGRPWMSRQVLIEGGNSYTFTQKLRMQKIDRITYGVEGHSPLIYLLVSNVGNIVANSVRITRSYNLSFSADPIGTT